jgi:hypothetical protein
MMAQSHEEQTKNGRGDADAGWTAEMVRAMLTNPVYVGMGPYPRIVEDDLWLNTIVVRIEREGAAATVESVLLQFRETLPGLPVPDAASYVRQAESNPRAALRRLLSDLRELADEVVAPGER